MKFRIFCVHDEITIKRFKGEIHSTSIMALTIQAVQLLTSIPKIIEFIIYLFLIIDLVKRYNAKPVDQRYILNKVFIFAFVCWAIYIFLDILIYILPVARIELLTYDISKENALTGYPLDFPELLIAQLLRDIAFTAGYLFIAAYLYAAVIIKSGEDSAKKFIAHSKISFAFFCLLAILSIANDQIGVYKQGASVIVEERVNTFGGAVSILMITGFLMVTSIIILRTLSKFGSNDKILRKRSLLIGIGVLLMGIGAVYWIIFGLARANIDVNQMVVQIMMLIFLGHMFWTISPILIYKGLKYTDKSS